MRALAQAPARRPTTPGPAPLLQRSCACGSSPGSDGECAACKAKRLQRQELAGGPGMAPPVVHDVLRSPGRALDPGVRGAMEAHFRHDFSRVRVHTDARAAESAGSVGAAAYTVGSDVVFDSGKYAPASAAGAGLLAHELAHVRQQAGATPSGSLQVVDDPAAEAEAGTSAGTVTRRMPVAVQRQPDDSRLLPEARLRAPPAPLVVPPGSIRETYILPAPPDIRLDPSPLVKPRDAFPDVLDTRLQRPTPTILKPVPRCLPDRPLTWADFKPANPPAGFSAQTTAPFREENVQGNVMFRALMNHAASKVRPDVLGLSDRKTNRCQPRVDQCRQALSGGGLGLDFRAVAPTGCDASVFTRATATSRDECESVIGASCDADSKGELARLLRHEQGHFDITCKLVGRADDALIAGRPPADVRAWLASNEPQQNSEYENDTDNGCHAGQQAAWETKIAGGLQGVPAP